VDELLKILESMKGYVCDTLCRYPNEAADQEKLEEICGRCEMNKHMSDILKAERITAVYHTENDDFITHCCGTDITNTDYKYCPDCGSKLGEIIEISECTEIQ